MTTTRLDEAAGWTLHVWLEGDMELLRRCDAVVLTPDWERSSGARAERQAAYNWSIPVYVWPQHPPVGAV